jgi:hypothetical protein
MTIQVRSTRELDYDSDASTRRRAVDGLLQDQFDSHLSPLRTGMGSKVQAARRSYR